MVSLLEKTCLKPNYSLRSQMYVSFGTSAMTTLVLVILFASLAAHFAGEAVKGSAEEIVRAQVVSNLVESIEVSRDMFGAYVNNVEGSVNLIAEALKDRIVGYPNDGWEDDRHVPFFDTETQTNRYPLQLDPLPLEWQADLNISPENAEEHLQQRASWVQELDSCRFSSTPVFFVQGVCDPEETNPNSPTFYPNCTRSNNNMDTGGSVMPTATAKGIYEKAADVGAFLKAVFEAQADALRIAVHFFNDGAGATLQYPGVRSNGNHDNYTSDGCEWLRATNAFTGEPLGTEEQIARCHPDGTQVRPREHNPVDRSWFADMALDPERVHWVGPLPDFCSEIPVVKIARSVFDRRTRQLIGWVVIDIAAEDMNTNMRNSKLHSHSEIAVVNFDDGRILADSMSLLTQPNASMDLTIFDTPYVDKTSFDMFQKVVDFSKAWTPDGVRQAYADRVVETDLGTVTAQPLPPPPSQYDPSYRPKWLVLHAMKEEVFDSIRAIDDEVDKEVIRMITISVFLGVVGMVVVLIILWGVSRMLTRPLLWMEDVAGRIIARARGQESKQRDALLDLPDKGELTAIVRCAPKTEIHALVSEFRKMIRGFSGEGASKVAESDLHEIPNEMKWQHEFRNLYTRVARQKSISEMVQTPALNEEHVSTNVSPTPASLDAHASLSTNVSLAPTSMVAPASFKRNKGMNIERFSYQCSTSGRANVDGKRSWRSPLFWWVFLLIAMPLFLTILIITLVVVNFVRFTLTELVTSAGKVSLDMELDSLHRLTQQKAFFITVVMAEISRNLHLLNRFAGWLSFGGITRSTGFTTVDSYAEECKDTPRNGSCLLPYSNQTVCSCDWEDPATQGQQCTYFDAEVDTRVFQRRFYSFQARDADPVTGRREAARSFPEFDNSPDTTLWWNDASRMPGSSKGMDASGYGTTYDRLRVSSAMAAVDFPVYNYGRGSSGYIGSFIAFDADGGFTGFNGCDYEQAYASYWNSTKSNMASVINPELCPLGKYGYEPRCRSWFASGKEKVFTTGEAMYVTAPYEFAGLGHGDVQIAASATAAIFNPKTSEYVGQTLLDFFPIGIRSSMQNLRAPLSVVVTYETDISGSDAVWVGPSEDDSFRSAPVGDLIFEPEDTINREDFDNRVLTRMKDKNLSRIGEDLKFRRMLKNGTVEELTMLFYPAVFYTFEAVDPSDFSAGARKQDVFGFSSVGSAWHDNEIRASSETLMDQMFDDLDRIVGIYGILASTEALLFGIFAAVIARFVSRPMIRLLRVVQIINSHVNEDIPTMQGSSREVNRLNGSFALLYRIVRVSNTAFFSGNLEWARHFISDALNLFREVEDTKAIGIVSNNLGNTLFALQNGISSMDKTSLSSPQDVLKHFDEAVEIAELEFEKPMPDQVKADFAVQLADRLFNRGLWLLSVQLGNGKEEKQLEGALADILRTRHLDNDTREFWLQRKLLLKNSSDYFSRLVRRIHGLSHFYHIADLRKVWDVTESIDEAERLLLAARENDAPLYSSIRRIGRLQQLEAAVIHYELERGNVQSAGRLAMRMMVEDEYILEDAFSWCAQALLSVCRGDSTVSWSPDTKSSVRLDLRTMLKSCRTISLDIGKSCVIALELSETAGDGPLLEMIHSGCIKLYDECCSPDDLVGVVAQSTTGELVSNIGSKSANMDRHRALLDLGVHSASDRAFPAFPLAVQMVIQGYASTEFDSFILLVADGFSYDSKEILVSIKEQVERLNQERGTWVHIIILGVNVENNEIVEHYKSACTVSKSSMYVDLTAENAESTFESVAALVTSRSRSSAICPIQGITMEKF